MASMETTTTLNGLYKEVYADKIKDLIPESDILLKMDNFVSKDQREGNKYHQPVLLALPTGATWGLGVVTLNTAIASTMGDAQLTGSAITHRDLLAYDAAAKAAKAESKLSPKQPGWLLRTWLKLHPSSWNWTSYSVVRPALESPSQRHPRIRIQPTLF